MLALQIGATWWQRLCACVCRKNSGASTNVPRNNGSDGDKTQHASHVSGSSVQSDDDDDAALAAIEAEVDDDLEVLSARSGEVGERGSSSSSVHSQHRRSSHARGSFAPMRGFGLHVNLASVTGSSSSALPTTATPSSGPTDSAAVASTPTTEGSSVHYVAAPHTPRSPRSDAESAYHSDDSDANRPLSAIPISGTSSMVMYGRPAPADAVTHHIV